MMQQSVSTSNRESLAVSETTPAGLLGYLAVVVAAIALLSAPVFTASVLLTLGVGVAAGRLLAARQRPAVSTGDDAATPGRDPATR